MTNFNAVIPILMHLFIFPVEKLYYFHKATSAVSCVKPNASQREATLRDDVGFPTVYRRIYRRKFLTLSNRTSRYIRKCIRMIYRSKAYKKICWSEIYDSQHSWHLENQFLTYPPESLGDLSWNLNFSNMMTSRSKISKIMPIGNPRWPPQPPSCF